MDRSDLQNARERRVRFAECGDIQLSNREARTSRPDEGEMMYKLNRNERAYSQWDFVLGLWEGVTMRMGGNNSK